MYGNFVYFVLFYGKKIDFSSLVQPLYSVFDCVFIKLKQLEISVLNENVILSGFSV